MKSLSPSGKISFVALAIVVIVTVLSLRVFAMASRPGVRTNYKFTVLIHGKNQDKYLALKQGQQGAFDSALIKLKERGGDYDINFACNDQDPPVHYNPHGQDAAHGHPTCRKMKTTKITKHEGANVAAAEASAANDPNTINRLLSNDAADINNVLITFQ